jgi:hypothetical protein
MNTKLGGVEWAGQPLPQLNIAGCLDAATELLETDHGLQKIRHDACDCCWRTGETFEPNALAQVHAISGDRCTGHVLLCESCRDAGCWPGNGCER